MPFKQRLVATAAAVGLAAGTALAAAPAASALTPEETTDFLGQLTASYTDPTVESDGNPYDFDIVTKAALVTGADGILAGLDSFTLFAPNDRAFEVLAKDLGLLPKGYRFSATVDETQIFNAIAGLGVDTITAVLLYHVVPNAKLTGSDVVSGSWYKKLTMANDQKLKVFVLSKRAPFIVLGDQDGRFFNDTVVRSKIDVIETDNTVVHGISNVLLPKL